MDYKRYHIKAGDHYSTFSFTPTLSHTIHFEGYFTEACLYHFYTADDYDINKLIGISTSINHHHQSARVGWRSLDGQTIQLLPYAYTYGKRVVIEEPLATVAPNERFTGTMTAEPHQYTIEVNGAAVTLEKASDWLPFRYILHPFFGGDKPAPNDMDIYLRRW